MELKISGKASKSKSKDSADLSSPGEATSTPAANDAMIDMA